MNMNGGLRAIATFVPKERKNCIYIMACKLNPIFMLKIYRKKYGIWSMATKYLLHEDKKEAGK
jgi:hypothetical protein